MTPEKTTPTARTGRAPKKKTATATTTRKRVKKATSTPTPTFVGHAYDDASVAKAMRPKIQIQYLANYDLESWGPLTLKHEDDSGFDLRATTTYQIHQGEIRLVPAGFKIAIPRGFELQVRPRSGLALEGLTVMNSPGTVDAGYRGEVGVILAYFGKHMLHIRPGDRIAQAVICPVARPDLVPVSLLPVSGRGTGGFGSTGKS